jgi:hypothetical protein
MGLSLSYKIEILEYESFYWETTTSCHVTTLQKNDKNKIHIFELKVPTSKLTQWHFYKYNYGNKMLE